MSELSEGIIYLAMLVVVGLLVYVQYEIEKMRFDLFCMDLRVKALNEDLQRVVARVDREGRAWQKME
jgi:hypothetical protein